MQDLIDEHRNDLKAAIEQMGKNFSTVVEAAKKALEELNAAVVTAETKYAVAADIRLRQFTDDFHKTVSAFEGKQAPLIPPKLPVPRDTQEADPLQDRIETISETVQRLTTHEVRTE